MLNRRGVVQVGLLFIFAHGGVSLIKLWAARHSTHDGVDGVVAKAAQVAF